uniref:Uncharacterized protein n=1 Tax=viral metagenome TaxID=1070528 RepID=A0A6M3LVZ7_9ZZZZ
MPYKEMSERKFVHPWRENYYIGNGYVVEVREGVRDRVPMPRSAVARVEAQIREMGWREV